MSVLSRFRPALLLIALIPATHGALAADPEPIPTTPAATTAASATPPSTIGERLFLAFAQDATLVKSQWWEGQVEYLDGKNDDPNIFVVRGVVAFHPVKSLEVGGRVGFGSASASGTVPDGSGATDLDAYGKWVFNAASDTEFAAGAVLTVPTGDDHAGLGDNAFAAQLFGSVRHRMDSLVLGGHVGVRFNGDGEFQGHDLNGKVSFELAVSAVFPLANQVAIVGEAQIETDRFENVSTADLGPDDPVSQLLIGINWRAFARGVFRGALAAGLTDGAPNYRVILGYAYSF